MKKLSILFAVIIICLAFVGCNSKEQTPTEATTTHTMPPTEIVSTEYEWAEIDCDMFIFDNDGNTIVSVEEFETFAVVGSTDEDSYIVVKVSDDATETIRNLESKDNLAFMIEGDTYGDVTYCGEPFNGEIEIGHALPYDRVCSLATTIRGLFN